MDIFSLVPHFELRPYLQLFLEFFLLTNNYRNGLSFYKDGFYPNNLERKIGITPTMGPVVITLEGRCLIKMKRASGVR